MAKKANFGLVASLTVAATLGGLLFGYDTAVISGATTAITYNFVLPWHLTEGWANLLSGFAIACALGSTYGFLQGAWPFGLVEAVWAVIALRRWSLRRRANA